MRDYANRGPCRLGGITSRLLLLLAVAALPGCRDESPTGPGEPATQPTQTDVVGAGLTAGESPADLAPAGFQGVTAAATRRPKSFFVNPTSGKDTNPGTRLKPFKTLARGLSTAIAGDTMRLASGIYGKAFNGERFTSGSQEVPVPAGVVILGTPAGDFTSRLQGTGGEIGLNLKGAATVRNVVVSGFTIGVRATQGVQSLKGLILSQNVLALELIGTAQTTLGGSIVSLSPIGVGLVTGARVRQQAQFTMDGGTITAEANPNCSLGLRGVDLGDAGRVTMKNVAKINNIAGNALRMAQKSKAILTTSAGITSSFFGLPCSPLPSVVTLDSASLTLKDAVVTSSSGTNAVGIESNSRAPLVLDGASVTGHSLGGVVGKGSFKLFATRSNFRQNNIGIDAKLAPTASITITGSTVFFNHVGIRAPFFKLRNSNVTLNDVGIVLTSPSADLGQTFDPGNNILEGNVVTGLNFDAGAISGGVGSILASGNTWNVSTQDSDGSGHYPQKPLLDNSSPFATGKNFVLPKDGNFKIQL